MTEMPRDQVSLVVGTIAAQVSGGLVPQMSPFMIGGLVSGLSLSERDAGFVTSIELLALALTAITAAHVLPRFSYRRVALVAVVVTLLAQSASIFSRSLSLLVLLRGISGIGEGALYAVSVCIVASRCSNPDKVYGYFQIVWALGSVALFPVGGQVTAAFAHRGIFALVAAVTLLLAPFLLLVPNDRSGSLDRASEHAPRASPLFGIMMLVATGLYLTVSAAIYAFSAPLGERAGFDTGIVGYALTVGSLVGLVGAAGATAINVRWGRAIPISAFYSSFAIVALALCLSQEPVVYVGALIASFIVFYFSIPYLFGLAAALDRSGRWATAVGSAYLLGFAAGPFAGGALIDATGYVGLAAACVAIAVIAWGLTMAVDRHLNGTTRALHQTVTAARN